MLKTKKRTNKIKNLLITTIFASVIYGFVLSQITANVLFVERIGANFLPHIYIANALLGALISLGIAASINKIRITSLVNIIALTGIALFLGNYYHILEGSALSYSLYFISSYTIYLILGAILIWDLAFKLCSPYEAKSKLGLFSFGASLGGILAGLSSSFLSPKIGTEGLILVLIASLVVTLALSLTLQRCNGHSITEKIEDQSYLQSLKEGFIAYKKSKLAKMVSLALLLFYAVRWIGNYQFQKIIGESFNETQFAQIAGTVSTIENLSLIFIFLLLQKRVIKKFGLMNTLLAASLLTFIPFFFLLLFPVTIMVAILKVSTRVVDYGGFTMPIKLVFTAIPNRVRSRIISFIGSNTQTGGILIAGVGLLVLTNSVDNSWIIASAAILALIVGVLILKIKKEYTKQIIKNLRSKNMEDVESAIENFAESSAGDLGISELMKKFNEKKLPTFLARKIIFSLGKIDNVKVIPSLLKIFDKYDITVKYSVIETIHQFSNLKKNLEKLPFTRLNIIDTYKKIFIKETDPELKELILKHLTDLHPEEVILFIINIIEETDKKKKIKERNNAIQTLKDFHDRGIIKYIEPFLKDKDVFTRASSIIALWQFQELRPDLLAEFTNIMNSNKKKDILATCTIISELCFKWESKIVYHHLKSPDPEIKTMAAITLMKIKEDEALHTIIKNLTTQNRFSTITAKSIKTIDEKMRYKILKKIQKLGEKASKICIKNLESTYYNFSDEIEYLK